MSPVATQTYGHIVSAWDDPLSWGTQAFIEYNGYILNDRHQADRIRVTSITGLDDADITDAREVVPGDIGEFVYDAFPRGRTYVLSGEIQAGSLGALKRLERDLKAAFAPLVESPMKFRWFDITDGFDDSQTLQNYTPVIGSLTGLSVSGGYLLWNTSTQTLLMRTADRRLWGDAQMTLRVVGDHVSAGTVTLIPKFLDINNYVFVSYSSGTTPVLSVGVVIAGTTHTLSSVNPPQQPVGAPVWIRSKIEGDLVTAELWLTEPVDTAIPNYSTSGWLSGSDADLLGDGVVTIAGFGGTTAINQFVFDDFKIRSIAPGDVAMNVRKLSSLSIKDAQESLTRFKRTFQITVRASTPYVQCATQQRSQTLMPAAGGTTQLGFGFPLTFPVSFRSFIPDTITAEHDLLHINNRGTAPTRPIMVVFGPSSNIVIANLANNMQVSWGGDLSEGDYLVFDFANRTLVNSNGNDQKQFFSNTDPRWLQLEPGWNELFCSNFNLLGNSTFVCFFRGAWN